MATTQINGDSHRILARTNDAPVVTLDTHGRNAQAVAFTSDGAFLLSAGQDACVRLWKPPGFRPAGELRGHTRGVYALALSPDRTRLATASRDGTVRVWALREREVRHILDQQMAAEFSPDGAQLATLIAGGFGLALFRQMGRTSWQAGSVQFIACECTICSPTRDWSGISLQSRPCASLRMAGGLQRLAQTACCGYGRCRSVSLRIRSR
jgi:hypothetical protein